MIRPDFAGALLVAMLILLQGCAGKIQGADTKNMQPQRPVQLDRLDAFVGQWEGVTETRIRGVDEISRGTLRGNWTWDCDKWCVVDRSETDLGDDRKRAGVSLWTWDVATQRYRFYWINSAGGTGAGTATYDEGTSTWRTKGRSRSPAGTRNTRGSIRFVDDHTADWVWQEFGGLLRLRKMLEMSGTSRKK